MENKVCEECGISFTYDMKPGFPRKYCPNCSAAKKASYEGKATAPVAAQQAQSEPLGISKDTSIIAQCLVKAVLGCDGEISIKQAVEMYKEACKLL